MSNTPSLLQSLRVSFISLLWYKLGNGITQFPSLISQINICTASNLKFWQLQLKKKSLGKLGTKIAVGGEIK